MRTSDDFDVVVAGGGVAGAAVAAALSGFGYQTAVVEPGMDGHKRLAGELVHPTGAAALEELQLLSSLRVADAARVNGFCIRFGGASDSCVVHLPYAEGAGSQPAFAMEHALIRERLLGAAAEIPGVTLLLGSRITGVDLGERDSASVQVSSDSGQTRLRCRLLVAADGGCSRISALAGIAQTRQRVSTLFGFLLEDVPVPDPGWGHAFLGAAGPVLAYSVCDRRVRVMFDLPQVRGATLTADSGRQSLHALPKPFRYHAARALKTEDCLASASYSVTLGQIVRGRLVLVGDAAGCCHPLTATGLTICARDAVRLRDSLRETDGDIPQALKLYAARRRAPQRTRLVLARALYEAFCGGTPELRFIRDGLREYWLGHGHERRRATSIALVSTTEERIAVLAKEFARVILCGFRARLSPRQPRLLLGLSRVLLRHAGEALRSA